MTARTHGQAPAIPDQPDGIEADSHDYPDPKRAAERILAYVASFGDGLYEVVDGNPLYGRDLEAVAKAVAGAVDWRRVAIELFKTEGACRGLSAQETKALLDAVDAEREARAAAEESAWGTRHERTVDAADRGPE